MTENTYTCRCCGNVYNLEPYGGYIGYSICPACHWEEDFEEEDEYSDCNGMTLREYRKDFMQRSEQL